MIATLVLILKQKTASSLLFRRKETQSEKGKEIPFLHELTKFVRHSVMKYIDVPFT